MAKEKGTIVIKKITIAGGGAHGGAWKVAFADFMTAMMCFFLVMWLLASSSEPSKKAVSDYFSQPSVIEYNFSNFGVELTLEKLFLDLINEPLKTLQDFMNPMDPTPNIMQMGLKKVVLTYVAETLGDIAKNVEVNADTVAFEIPDNFLFENGRAKPGNQFASIMEKVRVIVAGLEDSDVTVTSIVYDNTPPEHTHNAAQLLSAERADIVGAKVMAARQHDRVDVKLAHVAKDDDRKAGENKASGGSIKVEIKQKDTLPDGKKPRPIKSEVFGKGEADQSVYNNFVKQLSDRKKKKSSGKSESVEKPAKAE